MKKFHKFICLALAFVLVFSGLSPAAVPSHAQSDSQIEQMISQLYDEARAFYGISSFHGYCGAFVNVQLYLLGISAHMLGNNGNEEYDCYAQQTITTGGHRVQAYPASRYTLEEALNAITANGTKDAYNILVGFETTRSVAGRKYGHALLVHAIVDGTVYFMESYDIYLNDTAYPEGTPVTCTIPEFAAYYERTTVALDGVICFGVKSYADLCRVYPSYLTATADAGTIVRSQPCEAKVDATSVYVRKLSDGETVTVTGLYLNPEGEYWYQLSGGEGYVRADRLQLKELLYDDLAVTNPTAPAVLRQGRGYDVGGLICAQYNSIYTVRAQATARSEGAEALPISATDVVEGRTYKMNGSTIARELAFRTLGLGGYRYDLAAIVGNYYYERGQVQIGWKTVELWSAEFQVVEGSTEGSILTFDPNGGTTAANQSVVAAGDGIQTLPAATREGFVFLGWYTAEGERLESGFVPQQDLTLTAKWVDQQELYDSWQQLGQCRYLYSDGTTTTGCIEMDGVAYHFSSVDAMGQTWTTWTVA